MKDIEKPFIETFKWQSGKSLKQNLVDFGHSFWNLPVLSEIHEVFWPKKTKEALELFLMSLILKPAFQNQESPLPRK